MEIAGRGDFNGTRTFFIQSIDGAVEPGAKDCVWTTHGWYDPSKSTVGFSGGSSNAAPLAGGASGTAPCAARGQLIVLGDSVASGHHQADLPLGTTTFCDDSAFSYGEGVRRAIPALDYTNWAHSGFSIADTMVGKSLNACNDPIATKNGSPLLDAEDLLRRNAQKGNVVLINGGANDTNWSSVLTKVVVNSQNPLLSASLCRSLILQWDGWRSSPAFKGDFITQEVKSVVVRLARADYGAHVRWQGYYDVVSPDYPRTATPIVSPACFTDMQAARQALDSYLRAGVEQAVAWLKQNDGVDFDARFLTVATQMSPKSSLQRGVFPDLGGVVLLPAFDVQRPPGFPHPNTVGQGQIKQAVLSSLQ